MRNLDAPCPLVTLSLCLEALNNSQLPSNTGETEVPPAVYPKTCGKPGPIGPSPELISAIVEMKRRNPRFGYQRIADQISLNFNIEIEKDVVRRVLAKHYRPQPGANSPSWLTFLGHSKDSL